MSSECLPEAARCEDSAAVAYCKYSSGCQCALKRACAAQGPMEHTAFDFWTMVYGQKSSVVLMLTRHREGHGMIKVMLTCATQA